MNLKVFSLIAVFLICILAVNGLTEDDKGKIKDGLERYGNDSAKMGLLINTLNVGEDLSDENELRNEIVEKAAASGVNENYYNNIKEGKAPEAVLKLQEAKAEDAKIEEMVEAGKSWNYPLIILLIILIILLVLIGWWYGKRKA